MEQPDASTSLAESPPKPTEIEEFYEKLLQNNLEIKEQKKYLQLENAMYKKRYNDLKQRLVILTEALQNNARIYQQLFDDTNSARQICTSGVTISPMKNNKLNCTLDVQPGPSRIFKPVCHRKIHIEPLKIQELEDNAKEDDEETFVTEREEEQNLESNSVLSSIAEDKTLTTTMKELFVRLRRLPSDIVKQHLESDSILSENSTLNVTGTPCKNVQPNDMSTPRNDQLFMKTLGLSPIKSEYKSESGKTIDRLVNRNRNGMRYSRMSQDIRHSEKSNNTNVSRKQSIIVTNRSRKTTNSTLNETPDALSNLENNATPGCSTTEGFEMEEKENFVTKRRKVASGNPRISSTRPTRKARPTVLKEESLKRKKRRS